MDDNWIWVEVFLGGLLFGHGLCQTLDTNFQSGHVICGLSKGVRRSNSPTYTYVCKYNLLF